MVLHSLTPIGHLPLDNDIAAATLLHIDSSLPPGHSDVRRVAAAIVEHLMASDTALVLCRRDLDAAPLPHLSRLLLPADHALQDTLAAALESVAIERGRAASRAVMDEFLAADTVVIGVPSDRAAVPAHLKAWTDRLLIPGKTFRFTDHGIEGLAGHKRVIIVVPRDDAGGPGASTTLTAGHVESHLRAVMSFMGVRQPELILTEDSPPGAAGLDNGDALATALGLDRRSQALA
ncbi:FMN-dependent NADH-azoreductase [Ideonella sp. A 288]|uniref:FMN-dependent NADH-azoreductase n=1 Tax=Ideonella sp. A 288 TaxID=1962181 RepID=UPI000B4AA901|nr:NAD(P)H-dependent oxidoreductase [Ideonella sp. A 288]